MRDLDWRYLRNALLVFLICAITGVLLIIASDMFLDQKRKMNDGGQSALKNMNAKYRDAINQLKLVEDYLPAYTALAQQGFIGEENRLQWIEALSAISKKRKIPAMDYDIKAISPYVAGASLNTKLFQIYASEMTLKMKLLHERDLLDIFSDIDREIGGVYDIRQCTLQRKSGILVSRANAVNILAECTLGLYTIKKKAGKSGLW